MQEMRDVLAKIKPGMKIYYETPQTKNKYVQGGKALGVDFENGTIRVESRGREVILEQGTRIDISA